MNKKVYQAVISGKSDNNINYKDFQNLIVNLGFDFARQRGSHEMYFNDEIKRYMNIQNDGSKAKPYEIKQLRNLIKEFDL